MRDPERHKKYRAQKAAAEGRTVRAYKKRGLGGIDIKEARKERKRQYRRENGARLRSDISAEAEKKRQEKLKYKKHDAHVKLYKSTLTEWERKTELQKRAATLRQKALRKKQRETGDIAYGRKLLCKNSSLKASQIPDDLAAAKAIEIAIINHIKQQEMQS